jgi:hypothetical protein
MKRLAVVFSFLVLTAAPLSALALQERTITDEPGVSAQKTPPAAQSAQPAAQPPAQPAAPAAPAAKSAAREPAPASPGPSQWTPPEDSQKDRIQDEPAAKSGAGDSEDIIQSREAKEVHTYSRKEIDQQVMGFFEGGARGLADLISKAFQKYGRPVGFIKGEEGAGALLVGFRYGAGTLHLKSGQQAELYWQSPSVGLDLGVNASKVFCLVYNMTDINQIYQRFPGIDGSAYVVGGFGMTYQQSGSVILAPIRFGVGLRLGANVGYMHFTKEKTINPF